jgi:hypothetical protein
MIRRTDMERSPRRALLAVVLLALACGSGMDGPTGGTSPTTDPAPDTPAVTPTEAPGPWAPSRALAVNRFALETAVGSALLEPVGAELSESTLWTLGGDGVELRLQVRTWFNGAEAEGRCAAAAGDGAERSLALGTPVWTAADAVYVTQDAACIRVSVVRGNQLDLGGAASVVTALVTAS